MKKKLDKLFTQSNCISVDTLYKYVEGTLSKEERYEVEKHIADCELCSEAIESLMINPIIETIDFSKDKKISASPSSSIINNDEILKKERLKEESIEKENTLNAISKNIFFEDIKAIESKLDKKYNSFNRKNKFIYLAIAASFIILIISSILIWPLFQKEKTLSISTKITPDDSPKTEIENNKPKDLPQNKLDEKKIIDLQPVPPPVEKIEQGERINSSNLDTDYTYGSETQIKNEEKNTPIQSADELTVGGPKAFSSLSNKDISDEMLTYAKNADASTINLRDGYFSPAGDYRTQEGLSLKSTTKGKEENRKKIKSNKRAKQSDEKELKDNREDTFYDKTTTSGSSSSYKLGQSISSEPTQEKIPIIINQIEENKLDEALISCDFILQNAKGDSISLQTTQWLKATILFKKNEDEKAISILKELSSTPNTYQLKSQEILERKK